MAIEIAWEALQDALKNEEACDRYAGGYRKERKEKEGIDQACDALKEQIKKGVYLGTINNVCLI